VLPRPCSAMKLELGSRQVVHNCKGSTGEKRDGDGNGNVGRRGRRRDGNGKEPLVAWRWVDEARKGSTC
jgi:hypothetical protein